MKEYVLGNKKAIIIIHEIYGVNQFIEELCIRYFKDGYDVYSPSMINDYVFDYKDEKTAYKYFRTNVGYDADDEKLNFVKKIKEKYEKIFIIGFSAGATIAWRLSEKFKCDGVICCYGTRIRDYLSIMPACPALLLFAEDDSSNITRIKSKLEKKPFTKLYTFPAKHGFLDKYGNNFKQVQAEKAECLIADFLK